MHFFLLLFYILSAHFQGQAKLEAPNKCGIKEKVKSRSLSAKVMAVRMLAVLLAASVAAN